MKNNILFEYDADTKEIIEKISALCGLKKEIVDCVWKYTFFVNYINLLENNDKKLNEIKIPFLGKVVVKTNENKTDLDINWFVIDDKLKEIILTLKQNKDTNLVEFFEKEFLLKIITNNKGTYINDDVTRK